MKTIINKCNVPRALITIVGEIYFNRTYYISKFSNKKFFYIDKIFDLPKNNHYDPIVKAISISKAVSSSQAQSARDTLLHIFKNKLKYYFIDAVNTIIYISLEYYLLKINIKSRLQNIINKSEKII